MVWMRARWRWCLAVLLVVLLVPSGAHGYRAAQGLQREVVAHFSAAQAHLERARTLVTQATKIVMPSAFSPMQ